MIRNHPFCPYPSYLNGLGVLLWELYALAGICGCAIRGDAAHLRGRMRVYSITACQSNVEIADLRASSLRSRVLSGPEASTAERTHRREPFRFICAFRGIVLGPKCPRMRMCSLDDLNDSGLPAGRASHWGRHILPAIAREASTAASVRLAFRGRQKMRCIGEGTARSRRRRGSPRCRHAGLGNCCVRPHERACDKPGIQFAKRMGRREKTPPMSGCTSMEAVDNKLEKARPNSGVSARDRR